MSGEEVSKEIEVTSSEVDSDGFFRKEEGNEASLKERGSKEEGLNEGISKEEGENKFFQIEK